MTIEDTIRAAVREEMKNSTDLLLEKILEQITQPVPSGQPDMLRKDEVVEATGLSISSIYRMMSAETFPRSIQLGARSVGWRRSDINSWLSGNRSWDI